MLFLIFVLFFFSFKYSFFWYFFCIFVSLLFKSFLYKYFGCTTNNEETTENNINDKLDDFFSFLLVFLKSRDFEKKEKIGCRYL